MKWIICDSVRVDIASFLITGVAKYIRRIPVHPMCSQIREPAPLDVGMEKPIHSTIGIALDVDNDHAVTAYFNQLHPVCLWKATKPSICHLSSSSCMKLQHFLFQRMRGWHTKVMHKWLDNCIQFHSNAATQRFVVWLHWIPTAAKLQHSLSNLHGPNPSLVQCFMGAGRGVVRATAGVGDVAATALWLCIVAVVWLLWCFREALMALLQSK